jgi:uncharacterized protein (TIGR00730 family)
MTDEERDELRRRILSSGSYRLAEQDVALLARDELRPVRLLLELLKPELALGEHRVESTIVVFGGTQIVEPQRAAERVAAAREALARRPDDPLRARALATAQRIAEKSAYYDAAREFARLVSSTSQVGERREYVIVTGGGPGIMEAANRGAFDVGAKSVGFNITLQEEQIPNPYVTPDLCFRFHYFALRKLHFLLRARALVAFPGGFGTLDEIFETLTLRQTERMQAIPIVLFGRAYWDRVVDWHFLADEGVVTDEHLALVEYAETPQEAWELIRRFHAEHGGPPVGGPDPEGS